MTDEDDLSKFSDYDLKDELESRGYFVEDYPYDKLSDYSSYDLMVELESRDFKVFERYADPIGSLFTSFLVDSPDQFKRELTKFFRQMGYMT